MHKDDLYRGTTLFHILCMSLYFNAVLRIWLLHSPNMLQGYLPVFTLLFHTSQEVSLRRITVLLLFNACYYSTKGFTISQWTYLPRYSNLKWKVKFHFRRVKVSFSLSHLSSWFYSYNWIYFYTLISWIYSHRYIITVMSVSLFHERLINHG